jgi:microcystin degradation protein MlrC
MGVEGLDDPEGDSMDAMREVHPRTPMTVTMDFPANLTGKIGEKRGHPDRILLVSSHEHV